MKAQVAIVGGGPAGSATAMFLQQQGIEALLIEQTAFPRYHVGESMTGECGQSLRRLGLEEQMDRCAYPVKRGAAIYGAKSHKWYLPIAARDESWNLKPGTTWQVRRDRFDAMMLDAAVARGARLVEGRAQRPIVADGGAVTGVTVRDAGGRSFDVESELLLDCSGMATFLANAGVTGPKYSGNYDKQIAVFSQVAGTVRDAEAPGDTLLFHSGKYHWAWFIPLDDEVVSVGVVAPAAWFKQHNESLADYLKRELRELHPELSRRVPDTTFVEGVRAIPNYSYQVQRFAGPGFLCVGDAHRFVDPIFSFGLTVGLQEAEAAALAARAYLDGVGRGDAAPFAAYQADRERALDVAEDLIDAFWEFPMPFSFLVHKRMDEMIDLFAGRLSERQPSRVTEELRALLKRERRYGPDDAFSVPIGSRYRPERASIYVTEERAGIELAGELPTE